VRGGWRDGRYDASTSSSSVRPSSSFLSVKCVPFKSSLLLTSGSVRMKSGNCPHKPMSVWEKKKRDWLARV